MSKKKSSKVAKKPNMENFPDTDKKERTSKKGLELPGMPKKSKLALQGERVIDCWEKYKDAQDFLNKTGLSVEEALNIVERELIRLTEE